MKNTKLIRAINNITVFILYTAYMAKGVLYYKSTYITGKKLPFLR